MKRKSFFRDPLHSFNTQEELAKKHYCYILFVFPNIDKRVLDAFFLFLRFFVSSIATFLQADAKNRRFPSENATFYTGEKHISILSPFFLERLKYNRNIPVVK